MDTGATRYIGPHDVFAEEFIELLAMEADLRRAFLAAHGDFPAVRYRRRREEPPAGRRGIAHVVPYRRRMARDGG